MSIAKYNIVFNSFLATDRIEDWLKTQPKNTAHPSIVDGRRVLLVRTTGSIKRVDIHDVPANHFLNAVALTDLEGDIAVQLRKYGQLAGVSNFTLQLANSGDVLRLTPAAAGKLQLFCVTDRKGSEYFDLTVYTGTKVLTYNQTNVGGLSHSGDIGGLLHTVSNFGSAASGESSEMTFTVVGYNRKPLHGFVAQKPAVMVVDYDKEIIYMIPCPLDKASIGNSTLAHIATAHVAASGGTKELVVTVLPTPGTVDVAVNTGDNSATVKASVDAAKAAAKAVRAAASATSVSSAPIASTSQGDAADTADTYDPFSDSCSKAPAAAAPTSVPTIVPLATYAQATLDVPDILSGLDVTGRFGISWTPGNTILPASAVPTVLPHVFGPVSGKAAALGIPVPTEAQLPATGNKTVVICGSDMSDANSRMVEILGSCVLIVCAKSDSVKPGAAASAASAASASGSAASSALEAYGYSASSSANHDVGVEQIMNDLNINAACMASATSIILICINNKLYWYRGVRMPNLMNMAASVPAYGDDVTHLFTVESLQEWAKADSKAQSWPSTTSKNDKSVNWLGQMTDVSTVMTHLSSMDINQLSGVGPDIIDFLTQVSVLFETADVAKFRAQVDATLIKLTENSCDAEKEEIGEAYKSGDVGRIKAGVAALKGAKTKLNKVLRPISAALGNLESARGVSKKTQSIARRARADAIAGNVDRVKTMSMTEKLELFEQFCDSMAMIAVENDVLPTCLTAVGKETFRQLLSDQPMCIGFGPDDRMPYLDPCTVSSLLEMTTASATHPFAGADNMAIPASHTGADVNKAVIPIPLVRKILEAKDPGAFRWDQEANAEYFALYRIMMRGMISTATASRDFHINQRSDELGFFMIHMLLCAMEKVSSSFSAPPTPGTDDFDSTNCEVMRGLFGQLFSLMASTAKTLCPFYKLVYKDAPLDYPKANEWWVLNRMVPLFKYTCWDTTTFDRNCRRLFTEIVYKRIAHDPTEAMRKAAATGKKVQKVLPQEWRDFLRLMVDTIFDVASSNECNDFTSEMAKALLSYKPEDISRGTGMMCDYVEGFDAVEKYLHQVAHNNAATFSDSFPRIVAIALFSYIKHSGNIEGEKKTVRQKVHAATASSDPILALRGAYVALTGDSMRPIWATSAHAEHAERLIAVLGEKVNPSATASADAQTSSDAVVAPTPPTPAEILSIIPGSASAVATLGKLSALGPASLAGGFGDYSIIVGADVHTIRSMAEAMLMAWRSREAGIDAGMAALAGTVGSTVSSGAASSAADSADGEVVVVAESE